MSDKKEAQLWSNGAKIGAELFEDLRRAAKVIAFAHESRAERVQRMLKILSGLEQADLKAPKGKQ